ncbi:hypothetical protein D3C84_903850 [compost metagenome]
MEDKLGCFRICIHIILRRRRHVASRSNGPSHKHELPHVPWQVWAFHEGMRQIRKRSCEDERHFAWRSQYLLDDEVGGKGNTCVDTGCFRAVAVVSAAQSVVPVHMRLMMCRSH